MKEEYNDYLFKFIHEVKNPIAVCCGYLEIINDKDKKNINKYLDIIDKEIKESLNIMNDYLVLGRYNVNLEYMDLTLLIDEVVYQYSGYQNNGVYIDVLCDYEEIIILGDYTKLKQVFVNIIKNSIEAKKEGKSLNIKIEVVLENNNVILKFIDDGIGIENINMIGNKSYSSKVNGNGLGINFCKNIITQHKGSIAHKNLNNGTMVIITLLYENIF